jgi:hypothetical protein
MATAWRDLDEARLAHGASEVYHDAKGVSHYGQVCEDTSRPKQRVPVARDDLNVAEAPNRDLELPVEIGQLWRPAIEQRGVIADAAGVPLVDLTKGPPTARTCPGHEPFIRVVAATMLDSANSVEHRG